MNAVDFEKALYVTSMTTLRRADNGYSRLYFGNEFCQRLVPPADELQEALRLAAEKGMAFTFLTPYVTNQGLAKIDDLLALLSGTLAECEVVFNDWGVFTLLQDYDGSLKPVMGRLLNKMKRGPRLMKLLDMLPRETLSYYKDCNLGVPAFSRFLKTRGIERVELDNVLQGLEVDLGDQGLKASLYVPYAYVTTTRYCTAIACHEPEKEDEVGISPCAKECRQQAFRLTHPVMPTPLVSKGNTKFIKNDKLPELGTNNIDRLVYEPNIPL
jgi:hypothetical protein